MRTLLIVAFVLCLSQMSLAQDSTIGDLDDNLLSKTEVAFVTLKVYPNPIIDKFRLDLKEFQGKDLEVFVIKDDEVLYKKNLKDISTNSLLLSSYTIGLRAGKYKVKVVLEGKSFYQSIQVI